MSEIEKLGYAAAATRWADIPDDVRRQAGELFLDTLAVISAGLSHPTYAPFVAMHTTGSGEATIPGVDTGVPPLSASLVNGGATTVLQLQDGHRLARGHPASHLVPALLAVAESAQTDGPTLLEAFVAGYEVGARIGIAMGGLNPAIHDTGTWGTIAAAVAVTHLLSERDPGAIASAIEAAAAVAPMLYRETAAAGASVHHLYIGLGATTSVSVANAVQAGLSPLAGTLENFFGPRAGAECDFSKLTAGVDTGHRWHDYELMSAYIKVHPTCAHLHGVNDAVAQLIGDNGLRAEQVAGVDVATYAAALEFENPQPENDLAARFSIPGSVAIALCRGVLTVDTLTTATLQTDDVQELMTRIRVRHEPKLDDLYPSGRPCIVEISCHDGRQLKASVVHPLGDCTNPLTAEQRLAKATTLFTKRFGDHGARNVLRHWDAVFAGERISALSSALRSPAVN